MAKYPTTLPTAQSGTGAPRRSLPSGGARRGGFWENTGLHEHPWDVSPEGGLQPLGGTDQFVEIDLSYCLPRP